MDITRNPDMPADRCPGCAHPFNDATHVAGDAKPSPGDLSMCWYCGAFLEFNPDLTTRLLTLEDIGSLPDDVRISLQKVRRLWTDRADLRLG